MNHRSVQIKFDDDIKEKQILYTKMKITKL